MESFEGLVKSKVIEDAFEEANFINSLKVFESPVEAQEAVGQLLRTHKENYRRDRNDLALSITVEKLQSLAPSLEHLDKRLQNHMEMLRQNECSLSGTNTVLEYDSAKSKADKLVEILKAKKIWSSVYEEIRLIEPTDRELRYQKLLELQRSFDVLHKYSPKNSEREQNFERMKDEFLSWFSSATVLAIDTNDGKQINALREKYTMLSRVDVFEQIFGSYARNKIKCFLEDKSVERTLWRVLQEAFEIWKRCNKLRDSSVDDDSKSISENLFEGLISKWDVISALVSGVITSAETPFKAAREIGKVCADFSVYVETEGDDAIRETCRKICLRIFSALSEDYGKHATSVLLCAINRITVPEKAQNRYERLVSYVDEIHSCMLEIVSEARMTFDAAFPSQIIPSFEKGIKELNSLLMNRDIFNIRSRNPEAEVNVANESIDDRISAMCATGSILNLVDSINAYIDECLAKYQSGQAVLETRQHISNRSIIERLNRKVVARKVEAIVNSIIQTMNAEMVKLKLSLSTKSSDESVKIPLPSFSTAPHNYITNVGHSLLNVMNTISLYATNKNFICSIMSIAAKNYSEDEADLWLITEIGTRVMEAFCDNIGNISQLTLELICQFHADIVFLMEALIDLRLQPTARLIDYAERLKKGLEVKDFRECQVDTNEHFRHLLLFAFNRGVKAAKAIQEICSVYGENAMPESTAYRWFSRFKNKNFDLKDGKRTGRPVKFDEERLNQLIRDDPRQTTRELVEQMNCHHSTVADHLHSMGKGQKLGKKNSHDLTQNSIL